MITLIAAVGKNNEIGFKNNLLWSIPEDMKHFKNYTMGKVIVMGAKTFVSIGKPLPGRKNVVVTSHPMLGVITAKDITSVLSIEHCYNELVVIGGASVYNQTIDLADKLVITHIEEDAANADTFFPKIDPVQWKINTSTEGESNNPKIRFVEYLRNESSRTIERKAS